MPKDLAKRKPTEQSEYFLSLAANKAITGVLNNKGLSQSDTADVLHKIAAGLEGVAVGLRATYILLEQMRAEQQGRP